MSYAPLGKHRVASSAAALLALACLAAVAFADVTTEPTVLVFHNTGQSETVKLFAEGQPLSAHAVTGWRLMVERSSYSHMLRITPTDEGLRIAPSDTVEVGVYDLVVTTPRGNTTVRVYTPLSEHQSGIESLAQRMNISIEEVRKQAGMSQRLGRDQITLGLFPVYYLGQRIQATIPDTGNRAFRWKVNGETTQEGAGAHTFEYVAGEIGPLFIAYEERENNAVVAAASTLTEVAAEPAIPHEVKVGVRASFNAPPGYAAYAWQVDGEPAGTGATLEYVFNQAGIHRVTVLSKNPTVPGPYAFRETRYDVLATAD